MIVKLNEIYSISCRFVSTSSGFKHVASVLKNDRVVFETEVEYLNRTWESYEYETVLKMAIEKYFEGVKQTDFLKIIKEKSF